MKQEPSEKIGGVRRVLTKARYRLYSHLIYDRAFNRAGLLHMFAKQRAVRADPRYISRLIFSKIENR